MKLRNTLAAVLVAVMAVGLLSGCGGNAAGSSSASSASQPSGQSDPYTGLMTYDTGTGLTIRMEKGFEETQSDDQPYYQGESAVARFLAEDFESFEALGYSRDLSLEEYAALILEAYGLEGEVLTDDYGTVYITYAQEIQGADFTYYNFYVKGSDAFWTANFVCATQQKEELEPQFQLWASSIQVD